MFDHLGQQNIADYFKGYLMKLPTPETRGAAVNVLQRFENAPWYPRLFNQVLAEVAPTGRFRFEERKLVFDGTDAEARKSILAIMGEYLRIIETDIPRPRLYSTREAMDYLSTEIQARGKPFTPRSARYHIDNKEHIRGDLVGHTRVFTQAELNRFVEFYVNEGVKPGPKPGSHHKQKIR